MKVYLHYQLHLEDQRLLTSALRMLKWYKRPVPVPLIENDNPSKG